MTSWPAAPGGLRGRARRLLCPLLLLLPLAGCKGEDCGALSPRVEISFLRGAGLDYLSIASFKLSLLVEGGAWKRRTLTRAEAQMRSDGTAQVVVILDLPVITKATTMQLQVEALDSGGKVIGKGSLQPTTATLQPDGCNFVSVTIGTTSGGDGGVGEGAITGGDSGGDGGGTVPTHSLMNKQADLQILGEAAGDMLGSTVLLCDLDDDGKDDVVVAAPAADGPSGSAQPDRGQVHILLAKNAEKSLDLSSATADTTIYGAADGDRFGTSLACGDVDGDNVDDLVIGTPDANTYKGTVHVVLGGGSLAQKAVDLSKDNLDVVIHGRYESDMLGQAVAVVRLDTSGLGGAIAMGAPGYSEAPAPSTDAGVAPDAGTVLRSRCGGVFVLPGRGTWPASVSLTDLSQVIVMVGGQASEELGTALAAGNLHSNKSRDPEDLLAGGPGAKYPGTFEQGVVRVLRGRNFGGVYPKIDCSTATGHELALWGPDNKSGFGKTIVAGDVTGDGIEDLLMGAPNDLTKGKVYLTPGDAQLLPAAGGTLKQLRVMRSGDNAYKAAYVGDMTSGLGTSVAVVPRGSGSVMDLLLGAPGVNGGTGVVYWLKGRSAFSKYESIEVAKTSDLKLLIKGEQDNVAGDGLGASVAGGRINPDDNVPDVLLGAPSAGGSARPAAGKVYGIFGE